MRPDATNPFTILIGRVRIIKSPFLGNTQQFQTVSCFAEAIRLEISRRPPKRKPESGGYNTVFP